MVKKVYRWPENDVMGVLEREGWFAYSGDDGDLFRHGKIGSMRISVYPSSLRVQTKHDCWPRMRLWVTIYEQREPFDLDALRKTLNEIKNNPGWRDVKYQEYQDLSTLRAAEYLRKSSGEEEKKQTVV